MMEQGGFGIGKPCLLKRQDRSTLPVRPHGKANPAFMAAIAGLPVMPGPAEFNRLTRSHTNHLARHPVPSVFRFDHHRGPGTGAREIKIMFAKGDALRAPPGGQELGRRNELKGPLGR